MKLLIVLVCFLALLVSTIAEGNECKPFAIEGNSIVFRASNPTYKDKACYRIYIKVQRWKDAISRIDGRWRDTLRGTVWTKNDYYVCPAGDGQSHIYHLTFGLPSSRTGEKYAIQVRVRPGLRYTLQLIY